MMLKRIMTFAAVSAMTVALAGSAMAAETTKQLKPATGVPNKIKFTMDMKIYNVDDTTGGSAKAPDVKYTYTITGSNGGGGKTPVSGTDGGLTIIPGTAMPTISSAEFSHNDTITNHLVKKDVTVDFTEQFNEDGIDDITVPGIYRYEITETGDFNLTASQHDYTGDVSQLTGGKEKRYLDVYVGYNAAGKLEVKTAVMMKKDTTVTDNSKTTGYIDDLSGALTTDNKDDVSTFKTRDIILQKDVAGNMGSTTEEFKFTIDLSNIGVGMDYAVSSTNASNPTSITGVTANTYSLTNVKLKSGQTIKISGLPSTAKYKVTEDVSVVGPAGYKTTHGINVARITAPTSTNQYANVAAVTAVTPVKADDTVADTIFFLNYRDTPTPTGVVMSVAPFAIMIGAGILFILVFFRRRKREEEN